jgi:hypothetical protein
VGPAYIPVEAEREQERLIYQCLCSSLENLLQVSSRHFCQYTKRIPADENRKTDCTYCKTAQPSLVFSRSPTTPFPAEHTLRPSAPAAIAAAQARAEKEKDKSERWDRGLTLPGKLNMNHFEFKDEKTSIVFEDEDMVRLSVSLFDTIAARWRLILPDGRHAPLIEVQLPSFRLRTYGRWMDKPQ